jgi:hypothetical protein
MSDNVPTLRLPTTPPPIPPSAPPPAPSGRPSRGPMVVFILLCVLVVAAIGVLVWILVGRANATASNTAGSTQTSAPPATPSQPPSPPGAFTVFTVPLTQQCRGHGGPGKDQQNVDAQVTWATTNATQVWVAPGTSDAASAGVEQIPLSGNQDSFPDPLPVDCTSQSETFTMTLVGADGAHVSRTWTVMIAGRHD